MLVIVHLLSQLSLFLSSIVYNLQNLLFVLLKKKTHDDYLLSVYCIVLVTDKHSKLYIAFCDSFIKYLV